MCALVTGVQTCALPICSSVKPPWSRLNDFEVRRAAPSHGAKCWTRRTSKPASGCSVCFETCRDPIAPPTNTMVPLLSPHRDGAPNALPVGTIRSEEHTSELQSLMRISYAVFCLKKKKEEQHQ